MSILLCNVSFLTVLDTAGQEVWLLYYYHMQWWRNYWKLGGALSYNEVIFYYMESLTVLGEAMLPQPIFYHQLCACNFKCSILVLCCCFM